MVLRGAPQQHFHAGQQVVHVEGLGDEVVGAELQAQECVAPSLRGAADEDGHVGHRLEHAAQHQPVLVGQHQVENDQVGLVLLDLPASGGARPGDQHFVAGRLEDVGQHEGDGRVVLDQEDGDVADWRIEVQIAERIASTHDLATAPRSGDTDVSRQHGVSRYARVQ